MDMATWQGMTSTQRAVYQSQHTGGLSPQLIGKEGMRVEVEDNDGDVRRFWVGKSTGWAQIHLEVKTTRSMGGDPAAREYRSVRVVRTR
jgi:hypothetical protein